MAAAKIQSAGFGVRGQPVSPQPVGQILNVRVTFNGEAGKSVIRWKRDSHADAYVIQCTQDPTGETGWTYLATVPEAKFNGNGGARQTLLVSHRHREVPRAGSLE